MKLNTFTVVGYLIVTAFIVGIVRYLTSDPSIFFNKEALIVIVGGLSVAAVASFPRYTLVQTFHALKKIMTTPHEAPVQTAHNLVLLADLAQKDLQLLENELDNLEHPFLVEGIELILDGIEKNKTHEIMEKRMNERRDMLSQDVNVMMTLGKYAPALGLAATVLGLVELLSKLGEADLGQMGLGMAIALSATFYGIIISNMVFTPLSELLMSSGETDHKTREMIIDGVVALYERSHPIVMGELVNSYLPFHMRIDLEEFSKGNVQPIGSAKRKAA